MSDIAPNDIPTRDAILEEIARGTKASLERIERRLGLMDGQSRGDLSSLRAEQRAHFRWLLGVMIAGGATLIGVMAHGFHWL